MPELFQLNFNLKCKLFNANKYKEYEKNKLNRGLFYKNSKKNLLKDLNGRKCLSEKP